MSKKLYDRPSHHFIVLVCQQTDFMHQPVALFIGLRYMLARPPDLFGQFVSLLSTIGITLGVIALITTLSVMNGFENNLVTNILRFIPQVLITSKQGSINPSSLPAAFAVQGFNGVSRVVSLTTGDVVLQSASAVAAGVMLGVNPSEDDPLVPYLINVTQHKLLPHHYNVILGQQLAEHLNVHPGNSLRLIVPSVSQFTPVGRMPSQRIFTVIGTFYANSEVDSYQFLVNQQDASRLMHYPEGNISGWRLFLQHPLLVDVLITQKLRKGIELKDWRESKGELFHAVHMEKNMMALLLSLIVAMAGFNIVISLSLLVIEKKSEVAILQTQGLTRIQIMLVFTVRGAGAGVIGSLLGGLLGVLLSSHLHNVLIFFNALINDVSLSVVIEPLQVIIITGGVIVMSLVSTIYPAYRATILQPAEALRYE